MLLKRGHLVSDVILIYKDGKGDVILYFVLLITNNSLYNFILTKTSLKEQSYLGFF